MGGVFRNASSALLVVFMLVVAAVAVVVLISTDETTTTLQQSPLATMKHHEQKTLLAALKKNPTEKKIAAPAAAKKSSGSGWKRILGASPSASSNSAKAVDKSTSTLASALEKNKQVIHRPQDLASFVAEKKAEESSKAYLKRQLKKAFTRQRNDENQALGVRTAALREWAEYKLDLDDAEKVAKQSGRYSHAILKYAKKAVKNKQKEQKWAKKAYKDLQKAMKEEAKHPEKIEIPRKMTRHEKLMAASDPVTNFDLDPFYDRRKKPTLMEKEEDNLERRVFDGTATRSERKAYKDLRKLKKWQDKKRYNTFMGEVIEKVRKQTFGDQFDQLVASAESHARTAQKYTHVSSRLIKKAKALTKIEKKIADELNKDKKKDLAGKKGIPLQHAERVVVELVPPPKASK